MKLINDIITKIDEFPTLPTIYTKLTEVMANPRSTANDVANVIIQDQASTAKILKVVNSPIYGFRGKISSITQAVVYLGFDEVRNLVIALAVMDMFAGTKHNLMIKPIDLWKNSIAVGVICKHIAIQLKFDKIEEYFIAGILHGMGKLLFLRSIPELYGKVLRYSFEQGQSTREIEKQVIGMTNTVAGQLLADKWKLPTSLRDAIANQYTGKVNGEFNDLVATVHLSIVIASMLNLGNNGENFIPKVNIEIWDKYNFPENFFQNSLNPIILDYKTSLNIFKLDTD